MMNNRGGFFSSIPPVTKNLIIINVILWVAAITLPKSMGIDIYKYLGLHYIAAPDFNAVQMITYMFMHDNQGIGHLFFNMFSLFIFGRIIESVWGGKRFLFYYTATGFGAAIIQQIVWFFTWKNGFMLSNSISGEIVAQGEAAVQMALQNGMNIDNYLNMMLTVGASGAVFGILLAFGMMFPNAPMYIMFVPIPIKAKYIVIGYGIIELFFGMTSFMSGIAHFAHLGGMLFGFLILIYWKKKGILGGGYF